MIELLEQTQAEREHRREKNKHRAELLALLVGVEFTYRTIMLRYIESLLGSLLRIANTSGELSAMQVSVIRNIVRSGLPKLAGDAYNAFDSAVAPAAHYGVEMAGGDAADYAAAQHAAAEIVERGARGVPFRDVAANAIMQASNNFTSIVTMAALSGATIKSIEAQLQKSATALMNKLSGEAQTTVNAAFVEAARTTAGTRETTGLRWTLSPATDNHCKICLGRDGNIYPVDDEIWNDLPAHPNCLCWGEPVIG